MSDEKYFLVKHSRLQMVLDYLVQRPYCEVRELVDVFYNLEEGVKKESVKPKVLPKEAKA